MRGLLSTFTVIPITAVVAVGATILVVREGSIVTPTRKTTALPTAVTPASTGHQAPVAPVAPGPPILAPTDDESAPPAAAPATSTAPATPPPSQAPPKPEPQPRPQQEPEPIDYLALSEDVRRVSDTLERFNRKLLGAITHPRAKQPDAPPDAPPDAETEVADKTTDETEGQP